MKETVLSYLEPDCAWRHRLHWFETIDSTNTRAKAMAAAGAPEGTVLLAAQQTGGRGRMGRSFCSPAGMGVYFSVILRPNCPAGQLMHLTCAAAVTVCRAIKKTAGIQAGVKWVNDLVWDKRKLGGILTELSLDPTTGLVDHAVVGVGLNCLQAAGDFPPELQGLAVSLQTAAGKPVSPARLAAELIRAFYRLPPVLLCQQAQLMDDYRQRCVTLGQPVQLIDTGPLRTGTAVDVTADGGLVVVLSDGSTQTVQSGEVSVRGMYGYV